MTADELKAEVARLRERYAQEKEKRLRDDGMAQYIDLRKPGGPKNFQDDIFARHEQPADPELQSGNRCKYLVIGAGFGGLLLAVRLILKGIKVEDIRMVERADGFGGTWYYNRYPGVCCDVESYIYMPLLEEMGWVPSKKYAHGTEIRQLCEAIADKYGLRANTFLRRSVTDATWDASSNEWVVNTMPESSAQNRQPLTIRAKFVTIGPGLTGRPKLMGVPGLETFKGKAIHSTRWDWSYTGGDEENRAMDKLKDKTVGIIGTGCSAVQIVPEVAKWAKHVVVFQRTPYSVSQRHNTDTDPEDFKKTVATGPGWQAARRENFAAFCHGMEPPPKVDMVDDEITHWSTCRGIGGPHGGLTMETAPAFKEKIEEMDAVHTKHLRDGVHEIVKDPKTADQLTFWYNSWCKRPSFHDQYLQSFNRPNVTLVDTDGKGIDHITADGVFANGKEHKVDMLVYATGFILSGGGGSPSFRGDLKIVGREGEDLEDKFRNRAATLHGTSAPGFPNMMWLGTTQATFTPNQTNLLDVLAENIAYTLTQADERARANGGEAVMEPDVEACEAWTQRVMASMVGLMHSADCGPNYVNGEGDTARRLQQGPEERQKVMRAGVYARGVLAYQDVLREWRKDGKLAGMNITTLPTKA